MNAMRERRWPTLNTLKIVRTCEQCPMTKCLELTNGTTNVRVEKRSGDWTYIDNWNERRTIENCPKLR